MAIVKKDYKKIIKILASGLGVVILYFPWLFVFLKQTSVVSENYWIEPVTLRTIQLNFTFMFSTENKIMEILLIILFLLGSINAILLWLRKEYQEAICGVGVWFGTIFLGVALSIIIRPIFLSRYLMSSAACLWLGIAIGLSQFKKEKMKQYMVVFSIAICLINCVKYVKTEFYEKEMSRNTINELGTFIDSDTVIMSDYDHVRSVVTYFYPDNESVLIGQKIPKLLRLLYSDWNMNQIDSVVEIKNEYKNSDILVLDRDGRLREEFLQAGYVIEDRGNYHIDIYTFDAYTVIQ